MKLTAFKPIIFRVYGEPQPFPKKVVGLRRNKLGAAIGTCNISRDYRTRTDPDTGRVVKYDKDHKRRWMESVRAAALASMSLNRRQPFPKNHPIAMGCLFFLTRAKSCKLILPSQDPDLDNLEYAVWNALKRTSAKKKRRSTLGGDFPDGICFYDDNQIVWRLKPSGVLWADADNPPGVVIIIVDANSVMDEILAGARAVAGVR